MYEALENMGLKQGNILEPSCGVGNFMGLIPESMSKANMYGVELDPVSGRIAKQLYQKNKIAVQGFEENNSSWANEYLELKNTLSPEEYSAARASTLNAFYTSPTVIRSMYEALENMGDRKSTRLNSSHRCTSRMPSSA